MTAVDFFAAAFDHGRRTASRLGPEIAERIDWIEADLNTWTPAEAAHDLVISLYVHVAVSVDEMIARLGHGVAPGGLLVLVGHLPIDPVDGGGHAGRGSGAGVGGVGDISPWRPGVDDRDRGGPRAGRNRERVRRRRRRPPGRAAVADK